MNLLLLLRIMCTDILCVHHIIPVTNPNCLPSQTARNTVPRLLVWHTLHQRGGYNASRTGRYPSLHQPLYTRQLLGQS